MIAQALGRLRGVGVGLMEVSGDFAVYVQAPDTLRVGVGLIMEVSGDFAVHDQALGK